MVQCVGGRVSGSVFCSNHKSRQPFGIWDPPVHASLPEQKRAEATAVAKKRAVTAAGGTRAGSKSQPTSKGRARVEIQARAQEADSDARVELEVPNASAPRSRPRGESSRVRTKQGDGI